MLYGTTLYKDSPYKTLPKNCPNTEFFLSVFSHIWTEHVDLWSKSPYLVQIRENTDQKTSVFGYFSRSEIVDGIYYWHSLCPRKEKYSSLKIIVCDLPLKDESWQVNRIITKETNELWSEHKGMKPLIIFYFTRTPSIYQRKEMQRACQIYISSNR